MPDLVPKALYTLFYLTLTCLNEVKVSTGTLDIRTPGTDQNPSMSSKSKLLTTLMSVLVKILL